MCAKRVDDDWKRRAEDEKNKVDSAFRVDRGEVVEGQESAPVPDPDGVAGPMRVGLMTLVEQLVSQAMAGLGQMPDPRTGGLNLDLELARDSIDLIICIQAKTRSNLVEKERTHLDEMVRGLKQAFHAVAQAAAGPPMSPEDLNPPGA